MSSCRDRRPIGSVARRPLAIMDFFLVGCRSWSWFFVVNLEHVVLVVVLVVEVEVEVEVEVVVVEEVAVVVVAVVVVSR